MENEMKKEETIVTYVIPYKTKYEGNTYSGITIGWHSNIGVGEFDISINSSGEDQDIEVHTETRCDNEDKKELELILDKAKEYILENCKVVG